MATESFAPAGRPGMIADGLAELRASLEKEAPHLSARLGALEEGAWAGRGSSDRGRGDVTRFFPEIDYDRHPYYAAFADADEDTRKRAADRFFEVFAFLIEAEHGLARRAFKTLRRRPSADDADDTALRALRAEGFLRLKLSPSKLNEAHARSEDAVALLDARRLDLPPDKRGVEGVLTTLASVKAIDEDYEFYDDLLQGLGVFDLIERYYDCPFKFMGVTLQVSTGEDRGVANACSFPDGRQAPTYYMHMDSSVGTLKILMYRSERVTVRNGAFRYVRGSHCVLDSVQRAIRKACDKAGAEALKPSGRRMFMALPPSLRRKANFGNDLLLETGAGVDDLLGEEVVLEGDPGEGFLADVNGVHRGNLHDGPSGRREMFKFLLKATK